MSGAQGHKKREIDEPEPVDVSEEWQEDANEHIAELMEKRGETVPSIEELTEMSTRIDEALKGEESKPARARGKSDDTDALEQDIRDLGFHDSRSTNKGKKPHYSTFTSQDDGKPDEHPYQESFTSQQETAEMREEMSGITARLSNMESTLEMVIKERQNLPTHLERITQDINRQFTLMNERLNASIEAGMTTATAQQAAERLQEISTGAEMVLNVVKADLESPPSKNSQTGKKQVITGKKKKIQLYD